MRSRILVGLIAGAVGAFIGGLISEVLVPYNDYIKMVNGVCTAVQPSSGSTLVTVRSAGKAPCAYCRAGAPLVSVG